MAIDDDTEALRKISTTSSCPTEASFERNCLSYVHLFVYKDGRYIT